jgi:transcription elongation factor
MAHMIFSGGKQRHGSTVEVRDGRVLVDGKDVTPETGVIVQISGNVESVIASGGACIVIEGAVGTVMNNKGSVGQVINGNAIFGELNIGAKKKK